MRKRSDNAMAPYYFHQGTNTHAYEYMGAHPYFRSPDDCGWVFRVWAPNAESVGIVGDFCGWDMGLPMNRITENGIWETEFKTSDPLEGCRYKYRIKGKNGIHLKADPYGIYSETLTHTASILHSAPDFQWNDRGWKRHRKAVFSRGGAFYPAPLNIYEMHLGSFMTRDGRSTKDDASAYLNYREIAERLVPYLIEMGFTHVELMPVMEHPFDGSWGYQIGSYYAPTSRFGTPEDFKFFVNSLHAAGIGVILDWVPAHFPKDEHGLFEFDGQPCYENQGWDRMEHQGWGTRCFDVGRNEVQSFLISNALFWLREYHIDGLRVDAVAAMLYLDFDKKPGEWIPAPDGTNHNPESVAFFRKLNQLIYAEFPDVLMIAEESTAWPMITKPVYEGGLGFTFKWNMGWANDIFDYVATDPLYRRHKHTALTFPLSYAFSENYILPVSHDEVVHGKKSLLDKMFGSYEEKFAGMRAFLGYMMTQPGKKMLFMGTEYAPFREWDYENQLEWFMLGYDRHKQMQTFTAALNHLYLSRRELWEDDFSWNGYRWIEADQCDTNTISYIRFDKNGKPLLIAVNFSPVLRENYPLLLSSDLPGSYREIFSSDDTVFGGNGQRNEGILRCEKADGGIKEGRKLTQRLLVTLPGLSCIILAPIPRRRGKCADADHESTITEPSVT